MANYGIIIHGGAGRSGGYPEDVARPITAALGDIIESSCMMLEEGMEAIDVAEHAVMRLEDSGLFNAGMGSCLTDKKTIEMDAGIMDGSTMRCGGIGLLKGVKNPICIARKVMEVSEHSLIAGDGADQFAQVHDFEKFEIPVTADKLRKYGDMVKKRTAGEKFGTVGAVVLDRHSNVASAVSTGGIWLKRAGRIGDSAVVGAGYYASNGVGGAVSTGNGDIILKAASAKTACNLMETLPAQDATDAAVADLGRLGGMGGIIAVDRNGNFGASFNTEAMPHAYRSKNGKTKVSVAMPKTRMV